MGYAAGVNAIVGDNGQGKTNIVEALSYLCLTKSFYASSDTIVLKEGEQSFAVRGAFESDIGVQRRVEATYDHPARQKVFTVNGASAETMASVVGQFPVVILSPEQNGITMGAPVERRKFLDVVLAQSSRAYLQYLLEYRRILRQRNKLLLSSKLAQKDTSGEREPWDRALIDTGSEIMVRRAAFIESFAPAVEQAYEEIAGKGERPGVTYAPSFRCNPEDTAEAVRARFEQELDLREAEERRTGVTALGPHRDELELTINGSDVREFASQGQHKTLLIALKLAELACLKELCRETPLLLLDDVMSELDIHRAGRLVAGLRRFGQVVVTATDLRSFPHEFSWNGDNKVFTVVRGEVSPASPEHIHAIVGNGT